MAFRDHSPGAEPRWGLRQAGQDLSHGAACAAEMLASLAKPDLAKDQVFSGAASFQILGKPIGVPLF